MKILSKIAIGTALALVAVAFVPPVDAACGGAGNRLLTAGQSLVMNLDWGAGLDYGGDGRCVDPGGSPTPFGCLADQSDPPINNGLIDGAFWGIGAGATVNNGNFLAPSWTRQVSVDTGGFGIFHYIAFLTLDSPPGAFGSGLNLQPGSPLAWSASADIAGCIDDVSPAGGACTCLVLGDQFGNVGTTLVMGAAQDGRLAGDSDFTAPTDTAEPGPGYIRGFNFRPVVSAVGRDDVTNTATFTVGVPTPPAGEGIILKDGCACVTGFRVYVLERSTQGPGAPVDLKLGGTAGWVEATLPGGSPQPAAGTDLAETVPVEAPCDLSTQTELLVATALALDSNYESPFLSEPVVLRCDGTLADPQHPGLGRQRDPRPDKGKDSDVQRGRRR